MTNLIHLPYLHIQWRRAAKDIPPPHRFPSQSQPDKTLPGGGEYVQSRWAIQTGVCSPELEILKQRLLPRHSAVQGRVEAQPSRGMSWIDFFLDDTPLPKFSLPLLEPNRNQNWQTTPPVMKKVLGFSPKACVYEGSRHARSHLLLPAILRWEKHRSHISVSVGKNPVNPLHQCSSRSLSDEFGFCRNRVLPLSWNMPAASGHEGWQRNSRRELQSFDFRTLPAC